MKDKYRIREIRYNDNKIEFIPEVLVDNDRYIRLSNSLPFEEAKQFIISQKRTKTNEYVHILNENDMFVCDYCDIKKDLKEDNNSTKININHEYSIENIIEYTEYLKKQSKDKNIHKLLDDKMADFYKYINDYIDSLDRISVNVRLE
jgi:hypothetical protein